MRLSRGRNDRDQPRRTVSTPLTCLVDSQFHPAPSNSGTRRLPMSSMLRGTRSCGRAPNCIKHIRRSTPPARKCDGFTSNLDELTERNDPIATYLKGIGVPESLEMSLTYQDVLFGVAEVMGCPRESVSVFAVSDDLISGSPLPRLVSVARFDDDAKASNFLWPPPLRMKRQGVWMFMMLRCSLGTDRHVSTCSTPSRPLITTQSWFA